MRTEAGKMPESLIFPIKNRHGVSNDRFGFKVCLGFSAAPSFLNLRHLEKLCIFVAAFWSENGAKGLLFNM